jgi:hypothetical protein
MEHQIQDQIASIVAKQDSMLKLLKEVVRTLMELNSEEINLTRKKQRVRQRVKM